MVSLAGKACLLEGANGCTLHSDHLTLASTGVAGGRRGARLHTTASAHTTLFQPSDVHILPATTMTKLEVKVRLHGLKLPPFMTNLYSALL